MKLNDSRRIGILSLLVCGLQIYAGPAMGDSGWWLNRDSWFDGGVFWSVGHGENAVAADADAAAKMDRLVAAHIDTRFGSGTASSLAGFGKSCASAMWFVDRAVSPGSASASTLARLDYISVLDSIEARDDLSKDLRRSVRMETAKANALSKRTRLVPMSITVDSVVRHRISLFSVLAHWYTHKTFINGTIHGDVIDGAGNPIAQLEVKGISNSWPRNPKISEYLSPTRGGFPGDQTEFITTTDTDGRFTLPFSGYVGIRDEFRVTLSGLDTIFIHRENDGRIFAKYLFGYARIPITAMPPNHSVERPAAQ